MKIKNKTIKKVGMLAFLFAACPLFVFGGCSHQSDFSGEVHMHTYDRSTYLSDELGHWYAPTCEHVSLRGDYSRHVYDDEYDADCNVCGYVREVPKQPDPSDETPVNPPDDNPDSDNPSEETPASPILGVSVKLKSGLVTESDPSGFILNADCLEISVLSEVACTVEKAEFSVDGAEYLPQLTLLPADNAYSVTVMVSIGYDGGKKEEVFTDTISITVTQKEQGPTTGDGQTLKVDGKIISALPDSIESLTVLTASGENSVVISPQTNCYISTAAVQVDSKEVPAINVDAIAGEYFGIKITVTKSAALTVYSTSDDFAGIALMYNGEALTDMQQIVSPTPTVYKLSAGGEYNLIVVGSLQIYGIEVNLL